MPVLFVFLLKVNIALLLFCAGYYLVLRHLTFYTLNRIYLVGAIIFATVYPQINLDGFAQRHQQLTQPVQVVVSNLQAPAETLVKPLAQPIYWQWAEILFFAGAAFLAIRLLMQLFSLYKVYRDSDQAQIFGHNVRVISGDGGPFSFWKNIYVNPKSHEPADLKSILLHEQVHADELHTLDILIAELSLIFYWFNPGVWLMRKAVRENIEFITDRKILQKGIDSKKYQYSLLHVSFATTQPSIANHFNISTLKKRIIMMNAKKSSKANLTRYALLMPVVLICLLSFSFSKAELIKKSKNTYKVITASVTDIAELNPVTKSLSTLFQTQLTPKSAKKTPKDTLKIIRSGSKDTLKIIQKAPVGFIYNFKDGQPQAIITTTDTNHSGRVITNLHGYQNFTFVPGNIYRGKNADSNFRITLRGSPTGNGDAPVYVDGTRVTNIQSIDPSTIESYDIKTDDPPGRRIVITTKNAPRIVRGYPLSQQAVIAANIKKMEDFTVTKDGAVIHGHDTITKVRLNGVNISRVQPGDTKIFGAKDGILHDTVIYVRVNGMDIKNNPQQEVTVVGYGTQKNMPPNVADKNSPITVMGYGTKKFTETRIDNLSSKLIIIDGKETSEKEYKKLPAGDIKSITVKSGDDLIKQYGDKAKNGVLFIVTKK